MTDFDLDALERRPTPLPWFDPSGALLFDDPWLVTVPTERDAHWVDQVLDALPSLVQRLREAERRLERVRQAATEVAPGLDRDWSAFDRLHAALVAVDDE